MAQMKCLEDKNFFGEQSGQYSEDGTIKYSLVKWVRNLTQWRSISCTNFCGFFQDEKCTSVDDLWCSEGWLMMPVSQKIITKLKYSRRTKKYEFVTHKIDLRIVL